MAIFIGATRRGLVLLARITDQGRHAAPAATVERLRYYTHLLLLPPCSALLRSTHFLMRVPEGAVVMASDDAVDESVFDDVLEVWSEAERVRHERILGAIKREDRWWRRREHDSEQMRAKHAARSTEIALRAELEESGADLSWNPKRALGLQNFQSVFLHRERFDKQTRTWLEIVNAKITHVSKDGEDGYFKKLEQNIGWTEYITPIIFSHPSVTDKLVRCGIWSNAKNSRRCHQTEFCSLCLWNDVLKALVYAFGRHSGAFLRAKAWSFITIGWTVNPANAKCRCDDYRPDGLRRHDRNRGYDPYPVVLGLGDDDPDAAFLGYEDARILGIVMQRAVGELYHHRHINGYHSKREGEYRLNPGGANRVNFHDHTVANGDEASGQFLAEKLLEFVNEGLALFGRDLTRAYHPDIHVQRITGPEHLEHAIVYDEKVAPIGHAVADALARPEARGADGHYILSYIAKLKDSLTRLMDDDIPAIFTGARLNEELPRLFRRRTLGNMQFNDNCTCIGTEPDWHIRKRRAAAKRTRESRERQKKKREEAKPKAGTPVPPRKKYPRRRKGSRRLPRMGKAGAHRDG